jgi:hypothetical protein
MMQFLPGPLSPWLETGLRAAVSEIQRRNRERGYFTTDVIGHVYPTMTTEEMLKIIWEFLESAQEGLG